MIIYLIKMYKGENIMHYDDKGYYKMLWQQLKYGGPCDIVEDYKKLLQQLKEYIILKKN